MIEYDESIFIYKENMKKLFEFNDHLSYLMSKPRIFLYIYLYGRCLFQLLFPQTQPLKMIMLISLVCTLTQARIWVARVTFSSKGPMRGQNVFLVAKYIFFIDVIFFQLLFLEAQSLIFLKRFFL